MSKRRIRYTRFEPNRKFRRTVKSDLPTLLDAAFIEMVNDLNKEAAAIKGLFANSVSPESACASSAQVR